MSDPVETTVSRRELVALAEHHLAEVERINSAYNFDESAGWSASGIREHRDEIGAHLTRAADLLEVATQSDETTFAEAVKEPGSDSEASGV